MNLLDRIHQHPLVGEVHDLVQGVLQKEGFALEPAVVLNELTQLAELANVDASVELDSTMEALAKGDAKAEVMAQLLVHMACLKQLEQQYHAMRLGCPAGDAESTPAQQGGAA
jgi:hypothetical protein